MHNLQQHILSELIQYPTRRYADLKPPDVESNLFMYHLRKLATAGLIHKRTDGLYELTEEGELYSSSFSLKLRAIRAQPRITTLIACNNQNGEWLLYRRARQPLIGMVGFPYGSLHLGETIRESANRELLEKTGLNIQSDHRGDGYVTIYKRGQPVSQILFHLFYGRVEADQPLIGNAFWGNLGDIAPNQLIPSMTDLCSFIEQNPTSRFFAELNYELE